MKTLLLILVLITWIGCESQKKDLVDRSDPISTAKAILKAINTEDYEALDSLSYGVMKMNLHHIAIEERESESWEWVKSVVRNYYSEEFDFKVIKRESTYSDVIFAKKSMSEYYVSLNWKENKWFFRGFWVFE